MPVPLSSTPLKSRLLGGASLGTMVLAASLALTSPAMAQTQIVGATGTATDLSTPAAAVVSDGDNTQDFGFIDTTGAAVVIPSITLSDPDIIRVFDSGSSGDSVTVTTFVVNEGVSGAAVVFGQNADGTTGNAAGLNISGDLEGAADGRGGDLSFRTFDEAVAGTSTLQILGSTFMGQLTIAAGSGATNPGQGISAAFGVGGNDAFDVTGLTVNAGNGVGTNAGGSSTVQINADGAGSNIVSIGTGGITLQAGHAAAVGGGNANLFISDSTIISGAISITGGNEGTGGGGSAFLSFNVSTDTTVTVDGAITIATGMDTAAPGTGGSAEMRIAAQTFNSNGGVILSEQQSAIARLGFVSDRAQTFNGAITGQNDGDGQIAVNNSSTGVRFANDIGTSAARVGTITLTDGDLIEFDGSVFVGTLTAATAVGEAQFDGNVDVTTVNLNGVDTLLDFNGAVTIGTGHFELDGDGGVNTTATFSGAVGGVGILLLDDGATPGDVEVHFDGASAFSVANTIRGVDDNDGEIIISNTAGVTFNGRLGTMTTQGDRAFRQMSVAANGVAIFNNDVATQNFNVLGDGSTLTFNGAGAGPQFLVGNGGTNGSMALDDGTIILGSNIGDGDTIFDVTTGTNGDTAFAVTGTPAITVQLSAAVQNGHTVTLVDGDVAETISLAEFNAFAVTNTALMDFTLARTADGGTANANLVVTAAATSTAQAAATLGVSTEEADALRQATQSGDTTLVDLLTTALNTGGTTATQAARQVGVQSETVGGGSSVAREMAGQQQSVTGDRLGGFRSDDPRFVTAFAAVENGETGFAGGDLDAPYTPMEPRYANSVWGQVYGGTALADGTAALAGFDAGFGGAMIGIDGAWTDNIVIGAFAGYGFADVDGNGAGNAQLETSAYQAGVYAGYTGASFYVDAFAAYAMTQNDTTRTTVGPNTVTGSFDASQISVGVSGGAPIAISANGYLTPNASLTWNHYDADGYTEVGVGANTVTGFTANTLTGTIGARLHAVYEISGGSAIIPELSAGLIYDIIDDDGRASATFVGGGAAYTVSGTEISDIGAVLGAGLTMSNDVWSVGLSYEGDIRSDFVSHTGRAEVRMRF